MVNAMGMKWVSKEWQKELIFLLCPSSSQSIPRTNGILFNNVLLLQRSSIMSMFFISPALVLWHYDVQHHCVSWSPTTGLICSLRIFCGLWHMGNPALFIQQILLYHTVTASLHSIVSRRCHIFYSSFCFPFCSKFI